MAAPQLNSRLHLNHPAYFLEFALNLPQASFLWCSHSSNPNSGVQRDREQLLLAQAQDFVEPNSVSPCAFFPARGLLGHSLSWNLLLFYSPLLGSWEKQAVGPQVKSLRLGGFAWRNWDFLTQTKAGNVSGVSPLFCFSSVSQQPW